MNSVWQRQFTNAMGTERYSFLFKPGNYGTAAEPLQLKVGYYTEVAGLGESPADVQINGKIESFNRCYFPNGEVAPGPGGDASCFALNNFWRTLSNLTLTVNGAGQDGCTASSNFWAVSQAVSLRRIDVKGGNLSLMDYCSGPSFASGGFLADTRAGVVINGSQQQFPGDPDNYEDPSYLVSYPRRTLGGRGPLRSALAHPPSPGHHDPSGRSVRLGYASVP